MNVKKLIISIVLFGVFISCNISLCKAKASEQQMDDIDVMIAANYYLKDCKEEDSSEKIIWTEKIYPLYNNEGVLALYYITFSDNTYAVINNNMDNPTAIEFGEGRNKLIENLLEKNDYKIIYCNPFSIYNEDLFDENKKNGCEIDDLYECYPNLKKPDELLKIKVNISKQIALRNNKIVFDRSGNGTYGFINGSDMPSGSYTSDMIYNAGLVDWAIMDDYTNAENHCCATTVTNLALYFHKRGYTNLKINNSKDDTFDAVYAIVGDGPVAFIAGDAEEYFEDRGYDLNYSNIFITESIVSEISNERPCVMLLTYAIDHWHRVICVGWRKYTNSNDRYWRIVDNWYNTTNRYFMPGDASIFSITSFWVS